MTTLYTRRAIIAIRAQHQQRANDAAAVLDPIGGAGTFTVGLSPTGAAPATHYWCSWAMTELQMQQALVRFGADSNARPGTVFDAATTTPDQALATLGLQRIEPADPA